MGTVYAALDVKLGRRVALKLLRPDRVGGDRATRLLAEARTTAAFNHPHIVTIHEVGEFRGSPFLALEFVEGETLADRIANERPSYKEAVRIGLALANALTEAHRYGILHRDLKPGNVLIGRDGRVRVADFGIATRVPLRVASHDVDDPRGQQLAQPCGTPRYMAPEQWLQMPPSSESDVWSLGLILYQMICDRLPYQEYADSLDALKAAVTSAEPVPPLGNAGEVPPELAALIARCLSKTPGERPPAEEVARALELLLSPMGRDVTDERGPFIGLQAFTERDSATFCGRDAEIQAFVERLREQAVLPVVGPSGAGKTSLVQAGIIPRLREQGPWSVVRIRPGTHPFRSLAARLTERGVTISTAADQAAGGVPIWAGETAPAGARGATRREEIDQLAQRLRAHPQLLNLLLTERAEATRSRMLLVVDQLEEIYTLVDDEAERSAFMECVCAAGADAHEPVRVVFTLRDDFLGRVAVTPLVRRALSGIVVVRQLGPEEMKAALTHPVVAIGYRWEDSRLPDDMVAEVANTQAALPLLQFTAQLLWERRDRQGRRLLRSAYAQMGGVAGALADHADGVLSGLTEAQSATARTLLLRLVTEDRTRRVLTQQEALDGLGPDAQDVLRRLVDARLVASRKSLDDGGTLLELAHESLIHTWTRLSGWLAESREELALLAEVEQAAIGWAKRGRLPAETWDLRALEEAKAKLARSNLPLSVVASEFIQTGLTRWQRRRRRTGWIVVAALIVLATVAGVSMTAASNFSALNETLQEKIEDITRAGRDMGRFELEIAPFDWDPAQLQAVPVPASSLPTLDWQLLEPDPDAPQQPGREVPDSLVLRSDERRGATLTVHVETPGGPRFLRVWGRGVPGEECPPSLIPLRWLPGYADRELGPSRVVRVAVPTCRASRAGSVEIPAGPVAIGSRDPKVGQADAKALHIEVVHVEAFRIDETEVTNAAYAALTALPDAMIRDIGAYPNDKDFAVAARPEHPASFVSWWDARTFCRYMGKDLPTVEQWTMAVRGPAELAPDGRPTASSLRPYPWGYDEPTGRANLEDTKDEFLTSAPANSFADVPSPFGTPHLIGNVAEWLRISDDPEGRGLLQPIAGGGWDDRIESVNARADLPPVRNRRYVSYAQGFRCAENKAQSAPHDPLSAAGSP
jgi:formylglycine-generating enzyme required for sulfatase activity